jgi:hypothetical protein
MQALHIAAGVQVNIYTGSKYAFMDMNGYSYP